MELKKFQTSAYLEFWILGLGCPKLAGFGSVEES
jgi:hypothetical protein